MSSMNFWGSSSLFGSSSSSDLYSLFSERRSIQSGSYKKLLKSYYSSLEQSSGTSSSAKAKSNTSNVLDKILEEKKNPTVSKEAQKANAALTSGLSSLNTSVAALQKASTYENTQNGSSAVDKTVAAMKAYVQDYNDVVTAAKGSTLTNKTAYVANMMSATAGNADKLAGIGVTLNSDGTLLLDENKLKTVEPTKVQELFSADNVLSYGSAIASRAKFAGASATTATSSTNTETSTQKNSAADLKANAIVLASSELYAKVEGVYDVAGILAVAKNFTNNYNGMFDQAGSSSNSGVVANLAYIRERTADNANALEKFGFSLNNSGRLKLNEDTFNKADMSKVQEFFKDYGSFVAGNASRVDYYLRTDANASSGYTSDASYNVQAASNYNTFV